VNLTVKFTWRLWLGIMLMVFIWICFNIAMKVWSHVLWSIVANRQSFIDLIIQALLCMWSCRWNSSSRIAFNIVLCIFWYTKKHGWLIDTTWAILKFFWLWLSFIGLLCTCIWVSRGWTGLSGLWGLHFLFLLCFQGPIHEYIFILGRCRNCTNVWVLGFVFVEFW
jgi:hypothetical protein